MTILFMLLSFVAGYVACYFVMTGGVDQEGFWVSTKVSTKEFESD